MQILGNVLPGFREIRAPIIAGYLWLAFGWILAAPDIHNRPDEKVLGAIYDLGHDVGRLGVGIAVSVAAYLLGAISQASTEIVPRGIDRTAAWRYEPEEMRRTAAAGDERASGSTQTSEGKRIKRGVERVLRSLGLAASYAQMAARQMLSWAIWMLTWVPRTLTRRAASVEIRPIERVERAYARASAAIDAAFGRGPRRETPGRRSTVRNSAFDQLDHRVRAARVDARAELQLPAVLLVADRPELFAEVDRLRAEGEFRTTVIPPLVALALALSLMQSYWWATSLVGIGILLREGLIRLDRSRLVVSQAIAQRQIRSSSQEEFESWVDRFIAETLPAMVAREASRFDVLKAVWRTSSKEVDVTIRMRRLIENDHLTIPATNETMGGDPDEGTPKVLEITYRLGERTETATFREGEEVRLPPNGP